MVRGDSSLLQRLRARGGGAGAPAGTQEPRTPGTPRPVEVTESARLRQISRGCTTDTAALVSSLCQCICGIVSSVRSEFSRVFRSAGHTLSPLRAQVAAKHGWRTQEHGTRGRHSCLSQVPAGGERLHHPLSFHPEVL